MKRNQKTEVWEHFTFLDTETRPEDKTTDKAVIEQVRNGIKTYEKHEFYLAVACHYNRSRDKERWYEYTGEQADRDLWVHIDQLTRPRTKRIILAHNTKYDVIASGGLHWLHQLGYSLTFFAEDKPFIMHFEKRTEQGVKTIVMLSSTNWYGFTPLAKLGKLFGLEKLDVDVFNAPIEEILPYCRRDVEILMAASLAYINFVLDNDLGNASYTIASQAMKAFRHRFMKHDIYIHDNEQAILLERRSYCGGRTEAFQLGVIDQTVYGFDVNSMYPSVMRTNLYPVNLERIVNGLSIEQVFDLLNAKYLLTAEVYLDTDEPVYPVKTQDKRLIFPVGRFKAVLSTPEIVYAIEHGHAVGFGDICIYFGEPIFTSYIDFFYNERLKAKAAKDKIHDTMYKLFLNSLYGKFGQQNRYNEKYENSELIEPMFGVRKVINIDTKEKLLLKVLGTDIFYKRKLEGIDAEHAESFPAIAAHVTAYARMELWKFIKIAGENNVYYSDTDSLYTNKEGKIRLDKAKVCDNNALGFLKLERTLFITAIYGLKDYAYGYKKKVNRRSFKIVWERKLKGIPKKAVKLSEDEFLVRLWPSTSSFLREGNVRNYMTRLVVKKLKRDYNKGNVQANGKITPYRLQEF